MWLEHIKSVITKYQTKPENYEGFLDLNLDLPFAKFMMELLKPSVTFMKVKEYIKKHDIKSFSDEDHDFYYLRREELKYNHKNWNQWRGNITFSGIDDDISRGTEIFRKIPPGPNPVNLRFYLQKTLLDEINKEYFSINLGASEETKLHEVLNIIIGKTDSSEKITQLLNSISDILMHDLRWWVGFRWVGSRWVCLADV